MLMTTLMDVLSSPGFRVTVAESLIRDLGSLSEWFDLWGIKLNASKTKTTIVSRSCTMHPQLSSLTFGRTVLMTNCYIGSDISFQNDLGDASSLGF